MAGRRDGSRGVVVPHTGGVAVLAKAGMIWHGRQGSLSVFISRAGR